MKAKDEICPACLCRFAKHVHFNGEDVYPIDGDITVCNHCGAVLTFDGESFRIATKAEQDDGGAVLEDAKRTVADRIAKRKTGYGS